MYIAVTVIHPPVFRVYPVLAVTNPVTQVSQVAIYTLSIAVRPLKILNMISGEFCVDVSV